uniref:Uncharacterized protein n=1 Tax=Hyaloperonospora arabidopsidis (strain Emoy2) TaxID=559515 RepID=M4BY26_HYAAE
MQNFEDRLLVTPTAVGGRAAIMDSTLVFQVIASMARQDFSVDETVKLKRKMRSPE